MKITVLEVLRFIESIGVKSELEGKDSVEFEGYCPLNALKENSITWVRNIEDVILPEMN